MTYIVQFQPVLRIYLEEIGLFGKNVVNLRGREKKKLDIYISLMLL